MFLYVFVNPNKLQLWNEPKWNILNLGISHISKLVVSSCFLVFFPVDQIGMKILPPRQTVEWLGIVFFISFTSTFGLHYVELDGFQSGLICSVMLNWFWWNTHLYDTSGWVVYIISCAISVRASAASGNAAMDSRWLKSQHLERPLLPGCHVQHPQSPSASQPLA